MKSSFTVKRTALVAFFANCLVIFARFGAAQTFPR